MGTPARRTILTNLKTALEAITVAGGYKSTVKTVEIARSAKVWEEVPPSERPYIGVVPMESVYISEHVGPYYQVDFRIQLAIYVTGSSVDLRAQAMSSIIDDVAAAVAVDRSRGGAASDTWVAQDFTDEGDTEEDGCVRVDLKVRYFREETKS